MDAVTIQKIRTINRYKKRQLLNNLFFYFVTALTCSLLCSTPFWFPCLFSSLKVFFCVSLPKLTTVALNSKSVFVIGSLIVVFLVGESKALTSESPPASDVYHDEFMNVSRSLWSFSGPEDKKEIKVDKFFEEKVERDKEDGVWETEKPKVKLGEEEKLSLPELNKRADDFIARVNKQRRLEANL